MIITGTRFGNIDYTSDDVIHFPEGMIGFDRMQDYVVINTKEGSPFRWLQSLEEPKLAFLVSLPETFMESYAPEIKDEEAQSIGLTAETEHLVFVTTTIPAGKPKEATANLVAPIVVNLQTRKAKQVILDSEAYTIRYPIFSESCVHAEKVAA